MWQFFVGLAHISSRSFYTLKCYMNHIINLYFPADVQTLRGMPGMS